MARNERQTCTDLIEPALEKAGWSWQAQLRIGRGRVNLSGPSMYDETQEVIADYVMRYRDIPLAVLEAKAESARQRPTLYKPGRVKGTREIVVRPNYAMVYRVSPEAVEVLRVLHAAQQWP